MPLLVEYNHEFLNKSWYWLNDAEIKKLTLTPDFTKEDQVKFFNSLPQKKDYWIKGVVEMNEPIGVVGLKHISDTDAEYWGYIGEKQFWGRGIGSFMLQQAINKAKKKGLQKIYLRVSDTNVKAIQLYKRMGFELLSAGAIEKYELNL